MGDTLAHSSLAGVALGLMAGINPLLGAFTVAAVCGVIIEWLRRFYRRYAELALVIVMSLSLGVAVTVISSGNAHANVDSFLFGSILTVSDEDVRTVLILVVSAFSMIYFLFNRLLLITFDEEAAIIAKIRVRLINYLFMIIISATIAVAIRIVGVLVLSSMITLPVATALRFRRGFKATMVLAILAGFIDVFSGIVASFYFNAAPGGLAAVNSVILLSLIVLIQSVIGGIRKSPGKRV
jgi:zinc transport system permease protein